MNKSDFLIFYNSVVKLLANKFVNKYKEFMFYDNPDSLYEEYLNQKTILKILYEKNSPNHELLDRHKVCACMTVSMIKIRLLSSKLDTDEGFNISKASRVNEQLAFMCSWELFKGFIVLHKKNDQQKFKLPETFHNISFLDTITRSLFFSNQLNSLSTPLIANIFFLLEKYCDAISE